MSRTVPPASGWVLTEQQTKILDAVIQHGHMKGAADALGVTVKSIEGSMQALKLRNGMQYAHRLHVLLAWDQYRQLQQSDCAPYLAERVDGSLETPAEALRRLTRERLDLLRRLASKGREA